MINHGSKQMTVTHVIYLVIYLAAVNDVDSSFSVADVAGGRSALFIRNEDNPAINGNRTRQGLAFQSASSTDSSSSSSSLSSSSMEQTVHNILQWLQGKYTQNSRIARQQFPSRQYLPALSRSEEEASTTQKPRPFQTPLYEQPLKGDADKQMEGAGYYEEQPSTSTYPPPPYPRINPTPGFPTINTPASTLAKEVPKTVAEMPLADNAGFSQSSPDYLLQANKSTTAATMTTETTATGNEIDSEASHPPHVHDIHVECNKDYMTIDIEFNRRFDGLIYSKGHYNTPGCRHVSPNSGQTKYNFTVMLNSCGTQFVDEFSEGKQAYLENVLVLQNEIGIQEVWDSVRSVRCLWEGNLNKSLSVALSVGMLNQEVVTFSGDKATARLDIQMGRGPFAPLANGLVKIGEPMTLVVTVEGDPAFNVLVRECSARDNDPESGNIVKLTNDEGCILKPKLIGAFQMSRNPDTNSVISYAFFNAFKFPDIMDLTIECNIELCKTECRPCSNADQKTEPGRRRRRRRHLKKDNHHNSMMENQTGKQNKHSKSTSSPIGLLPHSMIVPRYPIQFSHHSANETKLRQNINITDFRNIIHSQLDFNSERISENSIDDLLPEIFINVDPIVLNRRFMVYSPGDILTADHVRQVTDDSNSGKKSSHFLVVVGSTNDNMKLCLTPMSYIFVATVLIATLVLTCVSCIMLWPRKRAKTVS